MTKLNKLNSHQAHYFLASMIISSSLNNRFINEEETEKQYYLKNNIDSLKFLSSEQKRILKNQESKKTLSLKSAKSVKEAFNKIRKALETTEISVENMTIKTIISYEANDKIPVDGIKNKSFEAIFNKNFKMYVKPVFNTLPYAEREKTSVTKIDVLPAESTKL